MSLRLIFTTVTGFLILLCSYASGHAQTTQDIISIEEARNAPHEQQVTVTGWVTVADELGGPSYIQDETAAIAIFPGTAEASPGDSVVVTGERSDFRGLEQINAGEDDFSVYPEGHREIAPEVITIQDLNTDDHQAQLIQINQVEFEATGSFSGESNYTITDPTGTGELRIDGDSELPGLSIPSEAINISGVAGHFMGTSQIIPRTSADLGTLIISAAPYETAATSTSITFSWETSAEGTSEVIYGTAPGDYDLGEVSSDELTTDHEITVDGLEPATIYHAQVRSEIDGEINNTGNLIVSTASPEEATQEINVYFNGSIDENLAIDETATGDYNFADHYIDRIENAEESIDVTFYNLSQNTGSDVTDALIDAHRNRGVQVRVIMDEDLSNPADENRQRLEDNQIPVIQSNPDGQRERGIMHNKIAIFDYHGGDPEDIWLVVSSWNTTDAGTYDQYQNMIEFQDPALAGGYMTEFEQMWGSSGRHPDENEARFGDQKVVVNPTAFWVDDVYIELYFSPQAGVETQIMEVLNRAQHDINVNTMGISRWNYKNTLEDLYNAGIQTRGVIGDVGIAGGLSEDIFDELLEFGEFLDHGAQSGTLLHHKAAIIDGLDQSYSNGQVITGSMNWTASGTFNNDENTIIIHDRDITNLYMQEFAARYAEAGGQDELVVTSSSDELTDVPESFQLQQNYPNPFNPVTTISFTLPEPDQVSITVFDMLGREVAVLRDNTSKSAGTHTIEFDGSSLSSGVYLYNVQLESGQQQSQTMTLVK